MYLFIILALASQETNPRNSQICDSYDDARDQYDCRKALAGGMECHSNDRRWNNTHASEEDVAWSVGMTCGDWPWYNGGYPLSSIDFDTEHETYTCIERYNGFCLYWEVFEQGEDEYEVGTFQCILWDNTHCIKWSGKQVETKNCEDGYAPNNFPQHTFCICVDDDICDDGRLPDTQYELSEATCTSIQNGTCATWTQIEWNPLDDRAFIETESYTCVVFGDYECDAWTGIISSLEELEISECSRSPVDPNIVYCTEYGHDMFFPNLGWAALTIAIFLIAIGLCMMFYNNMLLLCTIIVSACLFNILFVWLGGVGELAIALGSLITAGLIILCIFYGKKIKSEARDSRMYVVTHM